jgi:hypothetical protein
MITDPYYIVDYGDGSMVGVEKQLGAGVKFSYTYQTSGSFVVNITIFNAVSNFTKLIHVKYI